MKKREKRENTNYIYFHVMKIKYVRNYQILCKINKMIKKSNIKNKIVFAVKLDDLKCYWLQLTPQNYEREFKEFVKAAKMSINEAQQLKGKVERALIDRVRELKQSYQEESEKIKKELMEWKQGRYHSNEKDIKSITNFYSASEIKSYPPAQISSTNKQQIGIQVQVEQVREQPKKIKRKLFENVDKSTKTPHQLTNQNLNQQDRNKLKINTTQIQINQPPLKNIEQQQPVESANSPRFNQISSHNSSQISIPAVASEEETSPRKQIPSMYESNQNKKYSSLNKSTKVNSPQNSNKLTFSNSQHLLFNYEQKLIPTTNKKPFLLENYKSKVVQKEESDESSQLSFEQKPKKNKNPQIFNKLYNQQTISFQSKQMEQINTKEQKIYNEMVNNSTKKKEKIDYFQNMSAKTTKSFRSKFQPEPNVKEEKQEKQYQKAFLEHLKRKQMEKKLRQKMKQQTKEQSKPFKPKGSHCQAKFLRQKIMKQQKQREQKERQIKQRMKSNKKLLLTEKSCSPASKSRVCPCCSKSPHQESSSVSKSKDKSKKINIKILSPSNHNNKKYVSNILNESYNEFQKQINNIY